MKLSIVIPIFNKWNFTKSCLEDLKHLPKETHEIIVVDNASSDETQEEIKKYFNIKYIRNEQNLGFGRACNIGYAQSIAANVLFLNNDIRVKSDYTIWTQHLIEKCDIGLVGPTMGQLDDEFNFKQEANKLLDGNAYMSGWCLASSKENWKKLDISGNNEIFSEEFFCYFEDTDLSFRAKKLFIPFQIVEVPVVHFGKVSSKQLNTYSLYCKSRIVFINKWKKKNI